MARQGTKNVPFGRKVYVYAETIGVTDGITKSDDDVDSALANLDVIAAAMPDAVPNWDAVKSIFATQFKNKNRMARMLFQNLQSVITDARSDSLRHASSAVREFVKANKSDGQVLAESERVRKELSRAVADYQVTYAQTVVNLPDGQDVPEFDTAGLVANLQAIINGVDA